MNNDILNKFSAQLREVFARSIDTAWELQEERIPPIVLLWSIASQTGCAGADLLNAQNLTPDSLRAHFPAGTPRSTQHDTVDASGTTHHFSFLWPEFSAHSKKIIERSAIIAFELQHVYVGTEHLLLALIEKADEAILAVLAEQHIAQDEFKQRIVMSMRSAQAIHDIQHAVSLSMNESSPQSTLGQSHTHNTNTSTDTDTPALDAFGVDLTSEEQQRKLTPLIGRDAEVQRLIHILCRKTKNNPVLIGDPGVGKTALVEGLAQRIVRGTVPDALIGKRIIALDLTLMLSGTMYRGDYETRMKAIIEELKQHTEIIVFIDELHTIIGAGNTTPGSLDTAHMLKPSLARGELRCIGATTTAEYRKHIEADSALERRFQPITVHEPSPAETLTILNGIEEHYAKFHRVVYTDTALQKAVEYAERYLPERRFPDKAIDILDEAGAVKRSAQPSSALEKEIAHVTDRLRTVRKEKMRAIKAEKLQDAVDFKAAEDSYSARLSELKKQVTQHAATSIAVTGEDIAQVVSTMCHVPLTYLTHDSTTDMRSLRTRLHAQVHGQDEAIDTIVSMIERSLAGLHSAQKPLASVLCYGPSGVGKTTLAHALAEELFHDSSALLHVHMSEFTEGFAVSKMLGAPAGYVGHKDTIRFIEHLRAHPYSVIVFDEIEKAHPDVINVIMSMIDAGQITDNTGRTVLCNHALFLFISHIAEESFTKQAALGFELGATQKTTQEAPAIDLKDFFSSEFLQTLDVAVRFAPLNKKTLERIVTQACSALNTRLRSQHVTIKLQRPLIQKIITTGFAPHTGARGVLQEFVACIERPLATKIVAGEIHPQDTVTVSLIDDRIQWTVTAKKSTTRQKKKKSV